ncbi:MAG: hypothetical protein FJ088_02620, partial [Deltaproteobacteria bacterium]|nr:hypothetical protein [Deltaproteobacteria bacterium]
MSLDDILSALGANPADIKAFESLNEFLLGEGRFEELSDHYERLILKASAQAVKENLLKSLDMLMRKQADEAKQDFLCRSLAIIYKQENDLVKSEFYYRKISGKPAFAAESREFYVDFYAARGNWLRLEQFLTEEAQKDGNVDQYGIKRKLADTAMKYGNRDKALSYFQAVYALKPDDSSVEETLIDLYRAGEKWHSLAELLKEKARRVEKKEEKIEILLQMVGIFRDKLKAEPKVLATYNNILEIDPANMESLNTLQDYFEKTNRWPDLIKILQKKSAALF